MPTTHDTGLTSDEAGRRLAEHGPNRLAEPPRRSPLAVFADQFKNFLIVVLIGAAVLAGAVGEVKDTIVIGVVLLINAVLGFVQEYRAEQSLAALRRMLVTTARVRRDGQAREIDTDDVVPGDLLLLDAGDRVAADGRLVAAHGLEVDESSLTGESTASGKEVGGPHDAGPLGDRTGAVFMNTTVTRGRAEVEVTATGMDTEMGAVAGMLQSATSGPTPLQRQLDVLGKRLALVALAAVIVFVALELGRGQGLGETLLAAVALAVAAVPEGLPAVVTVTLALGTSQMAKRGAIVKKLASVETLGATSVICSDKTGTLTMNQMTARTIVCDGQRYEVSGEGYGRDGEISPAPDDRVRELIRTAVLCNDSNIDEEGTLVGDPTEGALLAVARKAGLDPDEERRLAPRIGELPFESAHKLMATVHRHGEHTPDDPSDDDHILYVKGALDVLLDRTSLDDAAKDEWRRVMEDLAADGLRVIGVAERSLGAGLDPADVDTPAEMHDQLEGLELLGVVGLLDPPRPEAARAIERCHRAGIDVKMITGDHARTAGAIAAKLGIEGEVVTGAELEEMDDETLGRRIGDIGVVARVAPEHKVRIVRLLKDHDHIVAMTGDGVNDAPALKTADIGVAMGITGTEVSKEAADMVLTDDNFATIVGAVEQGRTIYNNIVTFVRFQLATNIGAIFSLLVAPLVGLPVPFTAVQILWVNIIMDGPPAMALGVDPPRPLTMERPPRRPGERILSGSRLAVLVLTGAVMATGTLGVLAAYRSDGEDHALAMAFTTFVLFQIFNALNARTERQSIFRRATLANGKLWGALAAVVVLQVAAVHLDPVQSIFGTADLQATDWLVVGAVASSVLWVEEIRKAVQRARGQR